MTNDEATEDTAGIGVVVSAIRIVSLLDAAGVVLLGVAAFAVAWELGVGVGGLAMLAVARAVERSAKRRAAAAQADELGVRRAA